MVQTAAKGQARVNFSGSASWLVPDIGENGWNSLSVQDTEIVSFKATPDGAAGFEQASQTSSKEALEAQVKLDIGYVQGVGRLLRSFPIRVSVSRDGYTISSEELSLHAAGDNLNEVWEEFAEIFKEQADFYHSVPPEALSERAIAIRNNFRELLPKQGK
jgi:hypothetical protein